MESPVRTNYAPLPLVSLNNSPVCSIADELDDVKVILAGLLRGIIAVGLCQIAGGPSTSQGSLCYLWLCGRKHATIKSNYNTSSKVLVYRQYTEYLLQRHSNKSSGERLVSKS